MSHSELSFLPRFFNDIEGVIVDVSDTIHVTFQCSEEEHLAVFNPGKYYARISKNCIGSLQCGDAVRLTAWQLPPADGLLRWHVTSLWPKSSEWQNCVIPEPIVQVTGKITAIDSTIMHIQLLHFNETVVFRLKHLHIDWKGTCQFSPAFGDFVIVQTLVICRSELKCVPLTVSWNPLYCKEEGLTDFNKHVDLSTDICTHVKLWIKNHNSSPLIRHVVGIPVHFYKKSTSVYVRAFDCIVTVKLAEMFVNGALWNKSMPWNVEPHHWFLLWLTSENLDNGNDVPVWSPVVCYWTSHIHENECKTTSKFSKLILNEFADLSVQKEEESPTLVSSKECNQSNERKATIRTVGRTKGTLIWESEVFHFTREQFMFFGLSVEDVDLNTFLFSGDKVYFKLGSYGSSVEKVWLGMRNPTEDWNYYKFLSEFELWHKEKSVSKVTLDKLYQKANKKKQEEGKESPKPMSHSDSSTSEDENSECSDDSSSETDDEYSYLKPRVPQYRRKSHITDSNNTEPVAVKKEPEMCTSPKNVPSESKSQPGVSSSSNSILAEAKQTAISSTAPAPVTSTSTPGLLPMPQVPSQAKQYMGVAQPGVYAAAPMYVPPYNYSQMLQYSQLAMFRTPQYGYPLLNPVYPPTTAADYLGAGLYSGSMYQGASTPYPFPHQAAALGSSNIRQALPVQVPTTAAVGSNNQTLFSNIRQIRPAQVPANTMALNELKQLEERLSANFSQVNKMNDGVEVVQRASSAPSKMTVNADGASISRGNHARTKAAEACTAFSNSSTNLSASLTKKPLNGHDQSSAPLVTDLAALSNSHSASLPINSFFDDGKKYHDTSSAGAKVGNCFGNRTMSEGALNSQMLKASTARAQSQLSLPSENSRSQNGRAETGDYNFKQCVVRFLTMHKFASNYIEAENLAEELAALCGRENMPVSAQTPTHEMEFSVHEGVASAGSQTIVTGPIYAENLFHDKPPDAHDILYSQSHEATGQERNQDSSVSPADLTQSKTERMVTKEDPETYVCDEESATQPPAESTPWLNTMLFYAGLLIVIHYITCILGDILNELI